MEVKIILTDEEKKKVENLKTETLWAVHNLLAHPVSELCHWLDEIDFDGFGDWFHDNTIPDHEKGTGRG